jgi:hypothetical protein
LGDTLDEPMVNSGMGVPVGAAPTGGTFVGLRSALQALKIRLMHKDRMMGLTFFFINHASTK